MPKCQFSKQGDISKVRKPKGIIETLRIHSSKYKKLQHEMNPGYCFLISPQKCAYVIVQKWATASNREEVLDT